jgi:cytochrome oxidase Cu insertion factor (SCO1/SenC/PrrC family)
VDGKPFDWQQLRGRWALVMIDSGACAGACERKLWLIRQVRQAQGEALRRVERVWLIDDGETPPARLGQDYAGTWFVGAPVPAALAAFGTGSGRREHIYLVDPLGNLMMRFPADPDAKRLIRDLGRLLKYSSVG